MRITRMMGLALAGLPSQAPAPSSSPDRDLSPDLPGWVLEPMRRLDAARGLVLGLGLSLMAWTGFGVLFLVALG
jgi:hypothetical protein